MLKRLGQALSEWTPQHREGGEPLRASGGRMAGDRREGRRAPFATGADQTGDALVVTTRSSAWSEQLSFLAERILASLRQKFGLEGVRRLRFRVGKLSRRPTARVVRGTAPAPGTAPHARAQRRRERRRRDRALSQRRLRAPAGESSGRVERVQQMREPRTTGVERDVHALLHRECSGARTARRAFALRGAVARLRRDRGARRRPRP